MNRNSSDSMPECARHVILTRCFFAILIFASLIGFVPSVAIAQVSPSPADAGKLPLGIVTEKPLTGPSVPIDRGFMVPYEATIPGTNVAFTMMPIPGGQFTMGSPPDESGRNIDEGPQFEVTVEPFWMGKYEVTWAEYKRYMDLELSLRRLQKQGLRKVSSKNEIDAVTAPSSLYDPSYTFAEGDGIDQPAATVTQFAAMQYTKWLSLISGSFYRLPIEAEWEYACRAGTTSAYYFGDDPAELAGHAWFSENAGEERHAVGKLKPNPWGLHDMHGNVAEWVMDAHGTGGYEHVEAGSAVTTTEAYNKPTETYPRVARGGSFELPSEDCRSAARLGSNKDWAAEDPDFPQSPWWYIDSPASGVGFRLMRPLKEPANVNAKNAFWIEDVKVLKDAMQRNEDHGRGAYGPVDPELPNEINKLESSGK